MARPARNEDGSPGPTKIKSEISRLCAGAGRRARNTLDWRAVPCAPALPGEYGAAVHNYGCCAGYVNPDSEEAEASAANKRGRMQREFRRVEASANSFSRWTLRSDELGSSLSPSTPSTADVVVGVAASVAGRAAGRRSHVAALGKGRQPSSVGCTASGAAEEGGAAVDSSGTAHICSRKPCGQATHTEELLAARTPLGIFNFAFHWETSSEIECDELRTIS